MSKKSIVWKYYTKKGISATCNVCFKSIKHAGNTTNLMQRLQRKHFLHLTSENQKLIHKNIEDNSNNIESNTNDQEMEIIEIGENEADVDPTSTVEVNDLIFSI